MTITFTDDKYTQTVNGTVNERGTVKLGTDKKFTTIDLAITEGDDANKPQVGLVEVSGSTMKLKLALPGQTTRPTDFDADEGVNPGAVTRLTKNGGARARALPPSRKSLRRVSRRTRSDRRRSSRPPELRRSTRVTR